MCSRTRAPQCANDLALKILIDCHREGMAVPDRAIHDVITLLSVKRNKSRTNVMPPDQKYVLSELFGASKARGLHDVWGLSKQGKG